MWILVYKNIVLYSFGFNDEVARKDNRDLAKTWK